MSINSFNINQPSSTFAKVKESQTAGDYISRKKSKYTFINKSVNCCSTYPNFNKLQLYSNLYSELRLNNNVPVITKNINKETPTKLDNTAIPYLEYTIDASGNLFGNSVCGINNYRNYVIYNCSDDNTC